MGQEKLLMLIMSQNIILSPAVSRSEFPLCLERFEQGRPFRLLSKLDILYPNLCNIVDFVPIEERNNEAK